MISAGDWFEDLCHSSRYLRVQHFSTAIDQRRPDKGPRQYATCEQWFRDSIARDLVREGRRSRVRVDQLENPKLYKLTPIDDVTLREGAARRAETRG